MFIQRRFLSLYEYQAKQLLQRFNLPIQRFTVIREGELNDKNSNIVHDWKCKKVVVKAQVQTGGRGMGHFEDPATGAHVLQSGVHVVPPTRISELLPKMLGNVLVTKQGRNRCSAVMVAEAVDIRRELYLAFQVDRTGVRVLWNTNGGMAIENSHDTHMRCFSGNFGIEEAAEIASELAISPSMVLQLYRAFKTADATLLEINPVAITDDKGTLMCIDAKVEVDEAALFRHPEFQSEEPAEMSGSYVRMDNGNIGCLVNGAGLAMATMDILKLRGGAPANFLDIGGTATSKRVQQAINDMLTDPVVDAIWVNVFGGIVRGDMVAQGVIEALARSMQQKPLIVRLAGSNWQAGRDMLLGLPGVYVEPDFDRAASLAVLLASKHSNTSAHSNPINKTSADMQFTPRWCAANKP